MLIADREEEIDFIINCLFECDKLPGDDRDIDDAPSFVVHNYRMMVESILELQSYYKSHRPG